MKILAIESSCDETACAIVENGRYVLANVIASQIAIHEKTGGVVPEVAAREHVLKMIPVIEQALTHARNQSQTSWDDIDAIAVTQGPGLLSSLIIGTETANVLSYVLAKPLIPVNHIVGHLYSNWLVDAGQVTTEPGLPESTSGQKFNQNPGQNPGQNPEQNPPQYQEIEFPVLILTVSGGHNELILMRDHGNFEILGESLDDAAGEAFDKVAKLLDLGYPGGPIISKLAETGDSKKFNFPRPLLNGHSLDFSFSGLKTAVLYEVKEYYQQKKSLDTKFKTNVCASFQEAVVDVLSEKLLSALAKFPTVREVHLAGGVAANKRLRAVVAEKLPNRIIFRFPKSINYCTDNAAMIGAAGYFSYLKSPQNFHAKTNTIPSAAFDY